MTNKFGYIIVLIGSTMLIALCSDARTFPSGAAHRSDDSVLAPAAPEFAADTIPVRSPEGELTRYGLSSGKIVMKYTGDVTGTRTIWFIKWGMYERIDDSMYCHKNRNPMLNRHVSIITTPEWFMRGSPNDSVYEKSKNEFVAKFIQDDSLKQRSFGSSMIQNGPFNKRLPDRGISGYRCRVYANQQPNVTTVDWIWRGITMRQHVMIQQDSIDFWVSVVQITPNSAVPAEKFAFPSYYKELKPPGPTPGAPPDAPPPPRRTVKKKHK